MLKKCHKCQQTFDTDDFFCKNCGSILYEEKPAQPKQQEIKVEQAPQPEINDVNNTPVYNGGLFGLIKTYVTKKFVISCAYVYIITVVLSSILAAFNRYKMLISAGELLNFYDAVYYSLTTAVYTLFFALPGISVLKMQSGSKISPLVLGGGRAKMASGLGYMKIYYVIQAVFAGFGLVALVIMSVLPLGYMDVTTSLIFLVATAIVAAVVVPYLAGAISMFSTLKKNIITDSITKIKLGNTYCIYAIVLNVLASVGSIFSMFVMNSLPQIVQELGIASEIPAEMIPMLNNLMTSMPANIAIALIQSIVSVIFSCYMLGFLKKYNHMRIGK